MIKKLLVLSLFILLSTVESKRKQKVLKIVTDIEDQMVRMDDLEEIKDQIVNEVVDSLVPVIEDNCACCDLPKCQEGWEYFDHTKSCYKRFTNSSRVNWMDAQYDCRQHGGNLAIIHDEETNTFVNEITGGSMAWIGSFRVGPLVNPKPLNSQWTWNDGSPLNYSNWYNGQPDMGHEFCGHINRWDTAGLWNDNRCNSTMMEDFVCQSKVYSPLSGFYCPDGWIQFGTKGKCYKAFFGSSIITWMDAQKSCRFQGGDLAVIHDEETNIFVNDIADGTRAWIGAFRVGPIPYQNDEFSWIDGSAMDFDAWAVDQPDNYGGDEFCVHINLVENSADWNDYDCWSATNSDVLITNFVCQF